MPEMEVVFLEDGFDHVSGGGVGIGEVSMVPVAASIEMPFTTQPVSDKRSIRPRDVIEVLTSRKFKV